jgi:hypothetical protein
LWLVNGAPPAFGQPLELVIQSYAFSPTAD